MQLISPSPIPILILILVCVSISSPLSVCLRENRPQLRERKKCEGIIGISLSCREGPEGEGEGAEWIGRIGEDEEARDEGRVAEIGIGMGKEKGKGEIAGWDGVCPCALRFRRANGACAVAGWLAFWGTGAGKRIAYELRDWSGRDVDCGACVEERVRKVDWSP